ncbi:MAG TPA: helix-turn-helix transcriptional regulator [Dehalococcoidia bacterium]|nr:helix-turn-helix transcriptional regulator [Dehalococcoidia bacterium]
MRGRPLPDGWKRPYLDALGERLRELREAAGLSAPELAARVGTTRSHIHKLEAGKHAPRPEMAARLAAALGVDVQALRPR